MPDAALEDTELQFFALLDDASGDLPIYLKLYPLTGIPRAGCRLIIVGPLRAYFVAAEGGAT